MKKWLAIGIILLFIEINIIPATSQEIEKPSQFKLGGKWWFIGGNEPFVEAKNGRFSSQRYYENLSSSYNAYDTRKQNFQFDDTSLNSPIYRCSVFNFNNSETIYVPDDYPTIQLAINNSSPGDTIIVRDGTYEENIMVNKPLIIQSEHGYSSCTIKAKSNIPHVIKITSDYVSIIGFKIQGVSELGRAGIFHSNVNHTTILDNWLLLNDFGIYASESNDNSIHDNVIGSSEFYDNWGIVLHYTDNNLIYNNVISGLDTYAVAIELISAQNTKVHNNSLSGSYDLGFINSSNNIIENNTMYVGTFWAHILIQNSSHNILQNNTCTQGDNYFNDGVEIYDSSNDNQFLHNTFNRVGIVIFNSYHNIYHDNTVKSQPLVVLEDVTNYTFDSQVGQLILVNCSRISVINQELSDINIGLELFRVKDSVVNNVRIHSNNYEGIYSAFTENVSYSNMTLGDNICGIQVWNCHRTEIGYSASNLNLDVDFNVDGSPDTVIHHNSVTEDNGCCGMKIYNSENVSMCYNLISHLSHSVGLLFYNLSNSRIFANDFTNNYYPIQIESCFNLSLFRNNVSDSWGLAFITCETCTVEENHFSNCKYSCSVWESAHMTIRNHLFMNTKVHFDRGRKATVEGNDFISSNLEIDSVTGMLIFKNIFLNNSQLRLSNVFSSSQDNAAVKYNLFQNNDCALNISGSKGTNITANNFIKNKKNAALFKECLLRQIFSYRSYTEDWYSNYWDNWNQNKNYPIQGNWTINIKFFKRTFPIITIHYIEYDPTPAQEPYDILGMT